MTTINSYKNILEVNKLTISFMINKKLTPAVNNLSLSIPTAKTLALVGESGCGKSLTCLAIMRLLNPPAYITNGEINFLNKDILTLKRKDLHNLRGNEISMIFQEPMTSFDPVYTIGYQIVEALLAHSDVKFNYAENLAEEKLKEVGLHNPRLVMKSYPHELSGGMKQRAMIAMALITNPKLLLCDEPTTALDVTIQAQIIELLRDLQEKQQMSMLFITHNLGIVAELAHQVAVMYAGEIIEISQTSSLYQNPLHPYTQGLFNCIPKINSSKEKLDTIEGIVPNILQTIHGCKFAPRCKHAQKICHEQKPELSEKKPQHLVACHLVEKAI